MNKNMMLLKKTLLIILLMSCTGAEKMKKSYNAPFDGVQFNNIEPFEDKSFFTLLKWKFSGDKADWKKIENQVFYKPSSQRSVDLKLTLIGHSTVLIQVDNINILTDPHYSPRSSPVSWAGPKRVLEPAIKFENLPPIDLVLISHNHYDHLDLETLKELAKSHSPTFLVGIGNKELLNSEGISNVHELDWWQRFLFKEVPIHFVPVQHWSARSLFDKRHTLWGGFYIEARKKVFFAGDTGYGKVFKMIHEKYGDMDVGLIPIGAYAPRWFMKNAHINPEEAVRVFKDLKLKKGFGIHFGTFKNLTDEPRQQPIEDLKVALEKAGMSQSDFIAPTFGKEYAY